MRLRKIYAIMICVAFVAAMLLSAAPVASSPVGPDTVLVNGKIITVDPNDSIAEAVAITDGKIVAVGSNAEIRRLTRGNTEVIDLQGLTATPGLIDAHIHFSMVSELFILNVAYPHVESIVDIVELVEEHIASELVEPGEWVSGRGWDEGALDENRVIVAADLDPVSPDNPVWLTHTMGHYGVANSLALELAGIDENTPCPPGATIDRLDDEGDYGTPSGLLRGAEAMNMVRDLIPPFDYEQQKAGLEAIIQAFNEEGMTGAKDGGAGVDRWHQLEEIQDEGNLSVRYFFQWRHSRSADYDQAVQDAYDQIALMEELDMVPDYTCTGDDTLILGGVKLGLDGSGGARTAWVWDEWNLNWDDVDEGNYGLTYTNPDAFRWQVKKYHDMGVPVDVHVIGDRAIDWYVESMLLALEENPVYGMRHGIIHGNIPTDWAIDTIAHLQHTYDAAYPEPSATFMWWIGDTYAGNHGPERAPRMKPFQTWIDKGIIWGNGSDYGVTPYPARYGLWSSMARETLRGVYGYNPWGMEESISIQDALRSHTIWAAHTMRLEDKVGSIEVGKYADIAVWDKDMYSISVDEVKDLDCQMTLFEGEVVYLDPEAPIRTQKEGKDVPIGRPF